MEFELPSSYDARIMFIKILRVTTYQSHESLIFCDENATEFNCTTSFLVMHDFLTMKMTFIIGLSLLCLHQDCFFEKFVGVSHCEDWSFFLIHKLLFFLFP